MGKTLPPPAGRTERVANENRQKCRGDDHSHGFRLLDYSADAASHIFGYATGNDFTARDLQRRSSQWMLGKSCDGFARRLVTSIEKLGDLEFRLT